MADNFSSYAKFKDSVGEDYYCPAYMAEKHRNHQSSDWDFCVETSTVGRYAGNLNIVDTGAD